MHIGKLIREEFDRQPRTLTASKFADAINCRRSNVYDIFNRPTIDTELLMRICRVLNHDFFADLSHEFAQSADSQSNTPPI